VDSTSSSREDMMPRPFGFWSVVRFGLKQPQQRSILLVGLFVSLLGGLLLAVLGQGWGASVEALLGLVTTAIAVGIWIGDRREEWEEGLPRKLTVSFVFEDAGGKQHELMRCEEVYLASESDVRAWSQQIGAQMAAEISGKAHVNLSIFPDGVTTRSEIRPVETGEVCKVVDAVLRLREPPKELFQKEDSTDVYLCKILWNRGNGFSAIDATKSGHALALKIPKDSLSAKWLQDVAKDRERAEAKRAGGSNSPEGEG